MTTSLVRTRYGAAHDVAPVIALHERCSSETLHRRFHAALPRLGKQLARQLLAPELGWSVLAERGDHVVGMACAGPVSNHDLEVGILVEDAHQGRGIGSRLLADLAGDATGRGYRSLLCLTQPDNEAVLASVRRVGLRHTVSVADGLATVRMHLPVADAGLPMPA